MAVEVIAVFMDEGTVKFILHVKKNEEDSNAFVDPTSQEIAIYDPSGVQKSGYLSVTASASFTAGLVVTGTTSGATGLVISKPDGTTLELQQVTGLWQSGETITDTGSGTSTTTSVLKRADMAQQDSEVGHFEYLYNKGEDIDPMDAGDWHAKGVVIDGTGVDTLRTPFDAAFEVKE